MVALRAFALFTLLLCCSGRRIDLISHSYHHEKQQQEAKYNAQLKTGVSRPFLKALLYLLSASVGNGFVVEGRQLAAAPARSRPQLHSLRLDAPVTMELNESLDESTDRVEKPFLSGRLLPVGRREVLAGALLLSLSGWLPESLAESLAESQELAESLRLSGGTLLSRSGPNDIRSKEMQELMSVVDPDGSGIVASGFLGIDEDMARVMRNLGLDPTDNGVQRMIDMIDDGDPITDGEFLEMIKLALRRTLDLRLDQLLEYEKQARMPVKMKFSPIDPQRFDDYTVIGGDSDVVRFVRYAKNWAKQPQSVDSLKATIAHIDAFMKGGKVQTPPERGSTSIEQKAPE